MGYLVKLLERTSLELLSVAIGFLRRLSIYEENKARMAECGLLPRLLRLLPSRHEPLLFAALSLLHNLSFDADMRDEMVRHGFVAKVGLPCHAGEATPPAAQAAIERTSRRSGTASLQMIWLKVLLQRPSKVLLVCPQGMSVSLSSTILSNFRPLIPTPPQLLPLQHPSLQPAFNPGRPRS